MKRPKLAKLELRILEALWALGSASMRKIQKAFSEPRPAYTTITNTVYRMETKHAVRRVRKIGNADLFEPLIAKDAARDRLLGEMLNLKLPGVMLTISIALAQPQMSQPTRLEFDVASVKPALPGEHDSGYRFEPGGRAVVGLFRAL